MPGFPNVYDDFDSHQSTWEPPDHYLTAMAEVNRARTERVEGWLRGLFGSPEELESLQADLAKRGLTLTLREWTDGFTYHPSITDYRVSATSTLCVVIEKVIE